MKTVANKKNIANLLFLATLLTSAVGVATIKGAASEGDTQIPATPYSTLAMEEGASVRIADTKEEAGIRFRLKLSKTEYETLTGANSPYKNVSFGVLIAPEDYLIKGKELNAANVFGIGGTQIYGWAERNSDGTWNEYTGDKVEIVNFNTTTMSLREGEYRFDGSLVDILDGTDETETNNLSREFRGVGYMRYTEGEEEKVIMVGDDDNVRSIAYVAQKAIESGKITDTTDVANLTQFYVTGVKSTATVNHYKYGENGYELADTLTSDEIQIGDVFNTEKKSYNGYIFDADSSALSGTVYANEKTTLNVYYNPANNVLPELNDWAVMLAGYQFDGHLSLDYTPEFTSDNVPLKNTGTEESPKWVVDVANTSTQMHRTKQAQLVGHEEENLTYKNKEVAFSFSMPANANRLPMFIGADLSYLTKADLQALLDSGYTKLTFSFVHTNASTVVQGGGYALLDLEKVKNNPDITLRNTKATLLDGTTSCTKGRLNPDVFVDYAQSDYKNDRGAAKEWVDVEYAVADLIACYDQLFAGEDYWTLAIPYGDVGAYNYNAEWDKRDIGRCLVSKISFEKVAGIEDLSNVLPTLNDWAVMLGGYNQGYDAFIDYTPEFTNDNVAMKNAGTEEAPKWVIDQRNALGYLHKGQQVQLSGRTESDLTYKNKDVAFSFSMPANDSRLPIYIGAGLSHVTKADLQELLAIGYTKLSFSFVHNTCLGVVQQAGYWLLDLEKVKASLDTENPLKLRVEEATTIDGVSVSAGRLNLAAFKKTAHNYNNCNGASKNWVDVEYKIEDLIACYDVLFAGEDYWTLAIPYGNVGAYNQSGFMESTEANARNVASCYVSQMSFVK